MNRWLYIIWLGITNKMLIIIIINTFLSVCLFVWLVDYCVQLVKNANPLSDDPVFWDRVLLSQHYPAIASDHDIEDSGSAVRRTATPPVGDPVAEQIKSEHV